MPIVTIQAQIAMTDHERRLRDLRFPDATRALMCSGSVASEVLKDLECVRDFGDLSGANLDILNRSIADVRTLVDLAEANMNGGQS